MLMHFPDERVVKYKFSVTVSKLSVYFSHTFHYFYLHYAVLCLTNANVPLTHSYGFCNVTVVEKACPVIFRLNVSRTCTNDTNSIALSEVNCLFFLSMCIFLYSSCWF